VTARQHRGGDVDALVAEGLARYRAGDVDGALAAWEHALAADPGEPRALGYVDYVRQNYEELSGQAGLGGELLIPFGLSAADDDSGYEISILRDDPPAAAPLGPPPSVDDGWGLDGEDEPTWFARAAIEPDDELASTGELELDAHLPPAAELELDADLPPAVRVDDVPRAAFDLSEPDPGFDLGGAAAPDRRAAGFGDEDSTHDFQAARGGAELGFDLGLFEPDLDLPPVPSPAGAAGAGEGDGDPVGDFGPPDPTGELTRERLTKPDRTTARLAPDVVRQLGRDLVGARPIGPDEPTSDAWPALELDLDLAQPGEDPDPPPPSLVERSERPTADMVVRPHTGDPHAPVQIEELVLPPPVAAATAVVDDDTAERAGPDTPPLDDAGDLAAALSEEIDREAVPFETLDQRIRRRIAALIDRALAASRAGRHPVAMAAIDLALTEAPDAAAAQKLIHKSRDTILECYYRYFGDLSVQPVMAASFDQLTGHRLDSRAAFLLSRIDGTLSYEEILDVAGMGRLEACRHLALLLWRGLIRGS